MLPGFTKADWQEPDEAPPGGNVYAPINVGEDAQLKTGHLRLGTTTATGDPNSQSDLFMMYINEEEATGERSNSRMGLFWQHEDAHSAAIGFTPDQSNYYGFLTPNESVFGIEFDHNVSPIRPMWALKVGAEGRKIEIEPQPGYSEDILSIQPDNGGVAIAGDSIIVQDAFFPWDNKYANTYIHDRDGLEVGLIAEAHGGGGEPGQGIVGKDTTTGDILQQYGAGVTGTSSKGIGVRGIAGWTDVGAQGLGGLFTYGNNTAVWGSPWGWMGNNNAALAAHAWYEEWPNAYNDINTYHGIVASTNSTTGYAVTAANKFNNSVKSIVGFGQGYLDDGLGEKNASAYIGKSGKGDIGGHPRVEVELAKIIQRSDGSEDHIAVRALARKDVGLTHWGDAAYGLLGVNNNSIYDGGAIGVYGERKDVAGMTNWAGWFKGRTKVDGSFYIESHRSGTTYTVEFSNIYQDCDVGIKTIGTDKVLYCKP